MQIILLDKVINLGNLGEIVKVKDGYARNFLIPSGRARRATEAAKKELGVLSQRRVTDRQHKAVSPKPIGVTRIVSHDLLVKQICDWSHGHGGSGVTVSDLLNGVHGQESSCVDSPTIKLCPLKCRHSGSVLSCQEALHNCSVTTVAQRRARPSSTLSV